MKAFWGTLALMAIAILAACSGNNSPVTPAGEQHQAISMPDNVRAVMEQNGLTDDRALQILQGREPMNNPAPAIDSSWEVYAVTILWGHLINTGTTPGPVMDWTGNLGVNGVAVVNVINTISFEPNQDYLVEDSIPSKESWVSFTAGDFDGINCLIYFNKDIVYIIEPVLTFATQPIALQFSFGQLGSLNAIYLVDNLNAVAIHARRIYPYPCPEGVMVGQWIKANNVGLSGTFQGLWLSTSAVPDGVYTGTFWTNNDGTRQFSGQVSGYFTDQIIAYLEGIWQYDDPRMCPLCGSGHGWFSGQFTYVAENTRGFISGTFGDYSLPVTQDTLPMIGIWRVHCKVYNSSAVY